MSAVDIPLTASHVPLREVLFLALISALPTLSTDMYLGAMPTIAHNWHVTTADVSLSLILWFVAFSVALLVFGPWSDKHGRKPILLGGLALFIFASMGCAASTNIWELIVFRILQGLGAAGPSSMALAVARDRYQGYRRKMVLAYMGIVVALGPMAGPLIGSAILTFLSWRYIFVLQTIFGVISVFCVLAFEESIGERLQGNLLQLLGRYRVVVSNRRYFLANATMGLLIGPMFGFIAISSTLYIKLFGLSQLMFSVLFGVNALMLMIGAWACTYLTRWFPDLKVLTGCMVGCAIGGMGILLMGHFHYLMFAGWMCLVTFCCGLSRPLSNHLILEQVETDVGSASSFSVFYVFIVGAGSMALVSAPWRHPIFIFGVFAVLVPLLVLAIWPVLLKQLALYQTSRSDIATATAAAEQPMNLELDI